MLFTDSTFLFYFLPLSLLLHRVTLLGKRGQAYPNASRWCIFLVTLVFYGWLEPWWLIPFGFCIGCDFSIATAMTRLRRPTHRRALLILSIVQNIFVLGVFKYWNFVTANIARLFPGTESWLPHITQNGEPLSLPPGISFYVFESLSFVIDVYRGDVKPPKYPLEFFAFIGMFPRFMAGPIVRYRDMQDQLRHYSGMRLERGLFLFVCGLSVKVLLADSFAVFVPCAFSQWSPLTFANAWIGAVAFAMQLYLDFSGYSLMAIGLGYCFGFVFPANFRRPYLADSLQEFWRRWHISLSSWLRDYLYIPLGGSRRGRARTYVNLLLTMLIGGFWHGAQWAFVIWGAWHGAGLAIERACGLDQRLPAVLRRGWTLLVVLSGWVFFKANGPHHALHILSTMANVFGAGQGFNSVVFREHWVASALCLIGFVYTFVLEPDWETLGSAAELHFVWWQKSATMAVFVCTVILLLGGSGIPFLYYQF